MNELIKIFVDNGGKDLNLSEEKNRYAHLVFSNLSRLEIENLGHLGFVFVKKSGWKTEIIEEPFLWVFKKTVVRNVPTENLIMRAKPTKSTLEGK